jgi:hypothetical protein
VEPESEEINTKVQIFIGVEGRNGDVGVLGGWVCDEAG